MKYIGSGVGLRGPLFPDIFEGRSQSDWFEVITENLFPLPGFDRAYLLKKVLRVREKYPVAIHGVSLNIGSTDPVSQSYLSNLKNVIDIVDPCWVSDHMCWTGVDGVNLHDLMPLPYTYETLNHVVQKIQKVQEAIKRPLVLENVSSYFDYKASEMREWEFLSEVARRSGCELLLDINNICVSARNQGFEPEVFLNAIPVESIRQVHLAGPSDKGTHMVDTHDHPVREEVWKLFEKLIQKAGPISTIVERDDNIPALAELEKEVLRAKNICEPKMKGHSYESELAL